MKKKALITGITGQDGSYLAEFLLEKGYEVHGIYRRNSVGNIDRIKHIFEDPHGAKHLFLHYGDMTDTSSIIRILTGAQPDEIYNLAAQSHVRVSFDTPEYTANADAVGTLRILDAILQLDMKDKVKFYQASTSELYGGIGETPQTEKTPFHPRSPYGAAKLYAHWIAVNYREAYDIFACCGILFNHESPRRGSTFVTKKITEAVAAISRGEQDTLYLGNLYAKRDWGYAKEYVEAMWLMLQQDKPDDYVIATGETHTVKEFVDEAFTITGMPLTWRGEGVDEEGVDQDGNVRVKIDPYYFRPAEVDLLLGDPTKAKKELGWEPKVTFKELATIMMDAEK